MAYVVNDFARCYVYSGGFTFRRKAWLSWKCAAAAASRRRRRSRRVPPLPPAAAAATTACSRCHRRRLGRSRSPPARYYYRLRYIRDFYWPLAAAGLVLTVAILWWEGEVLHFGAWATFLTVVMYTANLWGVLMFIFLMSHALVRPPPPPRSPPPPLLSPPPPPRSPPPPPPLHRSSCPSNYGT